MYNKLNTTTLHDCQPGLYFLSSREMKKATDLPQTTDSFNVTDGRCIWLYDHGNGDEREGILICSAEKCIYIGACFGGNTLTWRKI